MTLILHLNPKELQCLLLFLEKSSIHIMYQSHLLGHLPVSWSTPFARKPSSSYAQLLCNQLIIKTKPVITNSDGSSTQGFLPLDKGADTLFLSHRGSQFQMLLNLLDQNYKRMISGFPLFTKVQQILLEHHVERILRSVD